MICGDHICINNKEAKKYFEENLSIEVKIIDDKKRNIEDLVELNLNEDLNGKRKVDVAKKNTNKKLKVYQMKKWLKLKRTLKIKRKK